MKRIQRNIATNFLRERHVLDVATAALGPDRRRLRILSFGCSIGDELATLRVMFPEAEVFGCEIDEMALERARESVGHLAHVFRSTEAAITEHGPYDLICAFSSLCIHPFVSSEDTVRHFPFSRFNAVVSLFHDNLVDGGVLATQNMTYAFADTDSSRHFTTIRSNAIIRSGFIPILGSDGGVIFRAINLPPSAVHFVVDRDRARDSLLVDCVFQKTGGAGPGFRQLDLDLGIIERPEEKFVQQAQWTRSNLDGLQPERRPGAVEVQTRFRAFVAPEPGGMNYVEQTVRRRSVEQDVWIEASRSGFHLQTLASMPK